MLPFKLYANAIKNIQDQVHADLQDLVDGALLLANKENVLEMDENGTFYLQAVGTVDKIIPIIEDKLARLKRIKAQRDSSNEHRK